MNGYPGTGARIRLESTRLLALMEKRASSTDTERQFMGLFEPSHMQFGGGSRQRSSRGAVVAGNDPIRFGGNAKIRSGLFSIDRGGAN